MGFLQVGNNKLPQGRKQWATSKQEIYGNLQVRNNGYLQEGNNDFIFHKARNHGLPLEKGRMRYLQVGNKRLALVRKLLGTSSQETISYLLVGKNGLPPIHVGNNELPLGRKLWATSRIGNNGLPPCTYFSLIRNAYVLMYVRFSRVYVFCKYAFFQSPYFCACKYFSEKYTH